MTIYNVIRAVYDCSQAGCHDGDPVIYIDSFASRVSANRMVNEIIHRYESDIDEDGENQDPFVCERTQDGAVCNCSCVEAIITIEETELK